MPETVVKPELELSSVDVLFLFFYYYYSTACLERMAAPGLDFGAILERLPPTDFAFAYGSGVFAQEGYENVRDPPMVDMVLATSDSRRWHDENLRRNRPHYSFVGSLGAAAVARIQEGFGAGLFYNTMVRRSSIPPQRLCVKHNKQAVVNPPPSALLLVRRCPFRVA